MRPRRPARGPIPAHVLTTMAMLRLPLLLVQGEADARILHANASFAELTGFDEASLRGRPLAEILAEGPAREARLRCRAGDRLWVEITASPLAGEEGGQEQRLLALRDITAQRRETDRLRMLLAELHHRGQNIFSAVLEMIRHSLAGRVPAPAAAALTGRVLALARAQNLLREELEADITLRRVLEVVLRAPLVPPALAPRLRLEGPELALDGPVALNLAMALHELAANAVRHGALSGEAGEVRIGWGLSGMSGGRALSLSWRESGGPRIRPIYERGFGLRLVEGSVRHALGGTLRLDLEATGLACDITLPLRPGRGLG